MTGIRNALTRKFGPLPAWAWLGILTVALYLYRGRGGGLGGTTADTTTGEVQGVTDPQDVTTLEPGESAYDPNTGSLYSTAPEQQTPGDPQVLEPGEGIYDPGTGKLIEPPKPKPTHKPKPKRHPKKPRGKHPKPHKHHHHGTAKPPHHGKHKPHGNPDVKHPRAHRPHVKNTPKRPRHPHPEPSPKHGKLKMFDRVARFTAPATTHSTESMRNAAAGSVRGTSRVTRPTPSHTVNSAAATGNRVRQRPTVQRSGVVRQRPVAAHTAPRQAQVAQRQGRTRRGKR